MDAAQYAGLTRKELIDRLLVTIRRKYPGCSEELHRELAEKEADELLAIRRPIITKPKT